MLSEVERLILRRRWILRQLRYFEERYMMDSREFYERWCRGEIPEPLDPHVHGDFIVWYGLVEELCRLERELTRVFRK